MSTPNWQVDLAAPPYVGPVAGLIAIVDTAYSPPRALAFVAPSLKAEAQLMASARELLAALQTLHRYMSGMEIYEHGVLEGDGKGENVPTCSKLVREAIAKAWVMSQQIVCWDMTKYCADHEFRVPARVD